MSISPEIGSVAGTWTYRNLIDDPKPDTPCCQLEFGRATIDIAHSPMGVFAGRVFRPGWSLQSKGAMRYGNPFAVRLQGRGTVGSELRVHDSVGDHCPPWPAGVDKRPAITESVARTSPHSNGQGGVAPVDVVRTRFAAWDALSTDAP